MAEKPRYKKQWISISCCIILSFMLTGCWNNVELKSVRMASAIGIDLNKDGRYLISVRMFNPKNSQGGGGKGSDKSSEKQSTVLRSSGYTVFDALRNLIAVSGFKLFYEHLTYVVLGHKLASQNITNVLDFLIRDHEGNVGSWVLVADGKAETVIKTSSATHPNQTVMIDEMLRSTVSNGKYAAVRMIELMRSLSGTDEMAYLPRIRPTSEKDNLHIHGSALIKKDKVVAEFNDSETRGLLWVRNKIKSTIIVLPLGPKRQYAAIETIRSKTDIQCHYDGKRLFFKVKIKPIGNIGEFSAYALNLPSYSTLEREMDTVILDETSLAIQKAQAYQADVFGFSEYAHRRYPRQWRVWKTQWPAVFGKASVSVEVDGQLKHSGQLNEQIRYLGE